MLRRGWLLGVVDLIGTGMEVYAVSTEEQLATPQCRTRSCYTCCLFSWGFILFLLALQAL